MATHNVSEVANNLDKYIDEAETQAVFILTKNQEPSVLISYAQYDKLMAAQERLEDEGLIEIPDEFSHRFVSWNESGSNPDSPFYIE